jgi:hypothetical protein
MLDQRDATQLESNAIVSLNKRLRRYSTRFVICLNIDWPTDYYSVIQHDNTRLTIVSRLVAGHWSQFFYVKCKSSCAQCTQPLHYHRVSNMANCLCLYMCACVIKLCHTVCLCILAKIRRTAAKPRHCFAIICSNK